MENEKEENKELQQEELLAVCAIYGDSVLQKDELNTTDDQSVYLLTLNVDQDDQDNKSPRVIILRLFLPSTYPSVDMPVFEIASKYCGNSKIDTTMILTIQQGFEQLFQPGQVVLFEWIQWLREYIEDTVSTTVMELTNTLKEEEEKEEDTIDPPSFSSSSDVPLLDIFSSEPLVDRKSIFVAHVAHVDTTQQVDQVMGVLLENKKIAKATHNIMAYRINLPGDRILQDNDDDGETAAGGRLMHLLQILDVKNVVVVVSRWYGGIQLGADRFKDINNCARKALEDCGYVDGPDKHKKKSKK
ncbi:ribosomal protein S5 domain 2-type protein [Chlamydoabsidia padenii]|nr:ribosomal protein S5 domain 2-type protein [Chlamydoabsidia padenii]